MFSVLGKRQTILRHLGHPLVLAATLTGSVALGATQEEWNRCSQGGPDTRIAACTAIAQSGRESRQNTSSAYSNRAAAYAQKGLHQQALADHNRAIALWPENPAAYSGRGLTYEAMGSSEKARDDYNTALSLPAIVYSSAWAHNTARTRLGALNADVEAKQRADEDTRRAQIEEERRRQRQLKEAEDAKLQAQQLAREAREAREREQKQLHELREAREREEQAAFVKDQKACQLNNVIACDRASRFPRATPEELDEIARWRLAPLDAAHSKVAEPDVAHKLGRRIALVIGNAAYREVGVLRNPLNDARAVASALRRLDFAQVHEHFDLDLRSLTQAVKDFGDLATDADWAFIYYAGHGIEMDGTTYVIPVDAKLLRDIHVLDEAIPLHNLLAKVEAARKLRLVILDACRNNPFIARMVRTTGVNRSVGRGLAPIEPAAGVLVAYSAKHGTLASDGTGKNSPFAQALLAHMEQPGLEINFVFRRTRDQVLRLTNGEQEPFLYGSLPGEPLFFKGPGVRRQ